MRLKNEVDHVHTLHADVKYRASELLETKVQSHLVSPRG